MSEEEKRKRIKFIIEIKNSVLFLDQENSKLVIEEIERLNNIINELEKYLIEQVEKSYGNDYDNVLDKLDELKGSDLYD